MGTDINSGSDPLAVKIKFSFKNIQKQIGETDFISVLWKILKRAWISSISAKQ